MDGREVKWTGEKRRGVNGTGLKRKGGPLTGNGERIIAINLDDPALNTYQLNMLSKAFEQYAEYCRAKAWVIRAKEQGNERQAKGYEEWCEEIYNRIPEWAQWR